jgi:hypothetical protein
MERLDIDIDALGLLGWRRTHWAAAADEGVLRIPGVGRFIALVRMPICCEPMH